MCMSPDEMSNDRIKEAIEFYQGRAVFAHSQGMTNLARTHERRVANFSEVLAEREAARAAEITEIGVPVFAEVAARRVTVSV